MMLVIACFDLGRAGHWSFKTFQHVICKFQTRNFVNRVSVEYIAQ